MNMTKEGLKTWREWAGLYGKENNVKVGIRNFGCEFELMTYKQFEKSMRGQTMMVEEEGLRQEIQGFKKLHKFKSKQAEIGFIAGLDMSLIALDKTYEEINDIKEMAKNDYLRRRVLKALDSKKK